MTTTFDKNLILDALRSVLPATGGVVALHEPNFSGNEWAYVKECIDTGWVSSVGKFVDRFERELAAYTGVKRAVAVVNGTAALHISLLCAGVQPGDEVLIPALTFIATANAVCYCGAVPHFIDTNEETLGADPQKLAAYLERIAAIDAAGCRNRITGRRIKVVVPMHTFGHPVDLDPLAEVCRRFSLVMIEDAAESLGSLYKGRHTGQWGLLSAVSFNGNKTITTGGGGAILTDDEELATRAKHITTTAKVPHPWEFNHNLVGYNYRMPNLNAALGCAQLEQLPGFLLAKRKLAQRYQEVFAAVPGIRVVAEPPGCQSNYWLNALLLDAEFSDQRDAVLQVSNDAGIMTRPAWTLMHRLPMFKECPRMDLSVAESLERRLINIPSSVVLGAGPDHA
ncbi:LegC family aminotransferase [Geomonas terrae]|uniref:GDP-perosamine synthase n=1 Tax=Geomonas terrae TaxID=2562681 RepID=A0A4S1CB78_9BACT|nr:LegC family aminotransferase [Geomonas terrae]TGU70604.1 LegC family aminotransferase [Geomonas terrae]